MINPRLDKLRLLMIAALALGFSSASFIGTLAALGEPGARALILA